MLRQSLELRWGAEQARSLSADQMNQAEVLILALVYDNLQAAMLSQKTVDQAVSDAAAAWNAR